MRIFIDQLLTNETRFSDPQISATMGGYMEIVYTVIAGRTLKDEATQKYTYVDVFNTIMIPRDQETTTQFFSAVVYVRGVKAGPATVEVSITHEDGTQIKTVPLQGGLLEGDLTIAARFDFVNIDKTGKHFVNVKLNGSPVDPQNKFYFNVIKQA